MAGFIPTCHTQTSVEVAKLEIFMIEIPSAIGLLIVLYFSARASFARHDFHTIDFDQLRFEVWKK
jgi:hypothetical protein